MSKRLLSLFLVLCMVTTMLPMTVFAAGGSVTNSGTVETADSGASATCENHKQQDENFGHGKAVEDASSNHESEQCPGKENSDVGQTQVRGEAIPSDDSGEKTTPPESQNSTQPIIITAFSPLGEGVQTQTVPAGTKLSKLSLPSRLQVQGHGVSGDINTAPVSEEIIIEGVTWEPDIDYEGTAGRSYIFSPILPDGFSLAQDVRLPEIQVQTIGASNFVASSEDADGDGYSDSDVAAMQAIIQKNGLSSKCDKNDISTWDFATWSSDGVKRLEGINFTWKHNPSGIIDVTGLKALKMITVGDGCAAVTGIEATNHPSLQSINCRPGTYSTLATLNVTGCRNLVQITCSGNQLTQLDLTGVTALKTLHCDGNDIKGLDFSDTPSLEYVECSGNQLTTLDVSGLTAMTDLRCGSNRLTSLNVLGLTNLKSLICNDNNLTELNLTGLTSLETLYCYSNKLISLDASALPKLGDLECENNPLSYFKPYNSGSLTAPATDGGFAYLSSFNFNTKSATVKAIAQSGYTFGGWEAVGITLPNPLATSVNIVLDKNITLTPTFIDSNSPANIVAAAKAVIERMGSYTVAQGEANTEDSLKTEIASEIRWLPGIRELPVSFSSGNIVISAFTPAIAGNPANPAGTNGSFQFTVNIEYNGATAQTVQLSGVITATSYSSQGYDQRDIAAINAMIDHNGLAADKNNPAGWDFVTWDKSLTPNRISTLSLSSRSLSGQLDVTALTELRSLLCGTNNLTGLNVAGLSKLDTLVCDGNKIQGLDVSGLTSLEYLSCSDNIITELKLSGLTGLDRLDCGNNRLSELNLSGLSKLSSLDCSTNALTELDFSGLSKLTSVRCDNNPITLLKFSGTDQLTIDRAAAGGQVQLLNISAVDKSVSLYAMTDSGYNFDQWQTTGITLSDPTQSSVNVTVNGMGSITPVFRLRGLKEAKAAVEEYSFAISHQKANTEESLKPQLAAQINNLADVRFNDVTAAEEDITITAFTAAEGATAANPTGTQGSFSFQVLLRKEDQSIMAQGSGIITIAPYVPGDDNYNGYYDDDEAAINTMIEQNNLNAEPDSPDNWTMVGWNGDSPKRIEELDLNSQGISGNVNLTSMSALRYLYCNGNKLTGIDVSGLTDLVVINCKDNPLEVLKLSDTQQLTVHNTSGGQVVCKDFTPGNRYMKLSAVPKDGYVFKQWVFEGKDGLSESDLKKADIFFFINEVFSVTPVYSSEALIPLVAAVESNSYIVPQADGNTVDTLSPALVGQINRLPEMQAAGIAITAADIDVTSFTPAVGGTTDNPNGTAGSFTFTVTLTNGEDNATAQGSGSITATKIPGVAAIGGTEYATLSDAFDGAQDGDTIILRKDIALDESVWFNGYSKTVMLDLCGYGISCSDTAIELGSGSNLTITDSSAEKSGVIQSTGRYAISANGNNMLTINGGTVRATEARRYAIEAWGANVTITITGGIVETTGSGSDAIRSSEPVAITITGGIVRATSDNSYAIDVTDAAATVNVSGGLILGDCRVPAGQTNPQWSVTGSDTLSSNAEIPAGKTFTIHENTVLTIGDDATLKNSGTIMLVGNGTVTGGGTLSGDGVFQVAVKDLVGEDIQTIGDQVYTGSPVEPDVVFYGRTIMGKDFAVDASNYEKSYENNIEAGDAKVIFTDKNHPENKVEKTFNILKSATAFDGGVKTYNGSMETNTFTYGDTIIVKAKPQATGQQLRSRSFTPPTSSQMALFKGNTQISPAVNGDAGGVYTMEYATGGKDLEVGSNTITAKYLGNDNVADFSENVTVTLNKKIINATVNDSDASASKVYDGSNSFDHVALTLSGVESGDTVTARADGTAADPNAGENKPFTATSAVLEGTDAGYYKLAEEMMLTGRVMITPATPAVTVTVVKKEKSSFSNMTGNHGDTIIMTAAVTGVTGGTVPAGTVTFKQGSNILASDIEVANGTASYEWINPNAGSDYTITAEFTAGGSSNYIDAVGASDSFDIDKSEQRPLAVTGVPTKVNYGDGSFTLSTTGGSGTGAVTYSVPNGNGVLTINGSTAVIVGVGTVEVTAIKEGDANYDDATATVSITVGKKAVTVKAEDKASIYNEAVPVLTLTMPEGTLVLGDTEEDLGVTLSTTAEKGSQAGTYDIIGTASSAKYDVTVTEGVLTINKADIASVPSTTRSFINTVGGSGEVNLAGEIEKYGPIGYELGTVTDADHILSGTPTVTTDGKLTFTISDTGKVGDKATIAVTVSFQNYNSISYVTTVELISQNSIAIEASASDVDYTGKPYGGMGSISASGYFGDFTTVYQENGTNLVGVPVNAGSYTVTVTPQDKAFQGEWQGSFTIRKVSATVKVQNDSMVTGAAKPSYKVDQSGFVNGESISGVDFDDSAVKTSIAGKYEVIPSGGVVSGGGSDNYDITYEKGYLTVMPSSSGGGGNGGSGGGSGSSGSSSSSGGTSGDRDNLQDGNNNQGDLLPPSVDSTTRVEIQVPAVVEKDDAVVYVTDKAVEDAIDKAETEAAKNGTQENGVTVVINVTTGNQMASSVTVNLSKEIQEKVIAERVANIVVVVDHPDVEISLNLPAITEINKQADADVKLNAMRIDPTKLTGDAQEAVGNRPVFDFNVGYDDDKTVKNFGGGSVNVTIPYTLQKGEIAENVQAVYVDDSGRVTYLTNSSYDSMDKVLRFSTNHFSTYGVGYKATPAFTDINSHWAKDDILFAVNRGLFSGESSTTFSPDTAMTRGMFVTVLGRLSGIDPAQYQSTRFTDVGQAYYAPYVAWAAEKAIVSGTSENTFAPDTAISRQEMAVIMQNYAKVMGYTVPKTCEAITFADSGSIADWAKDAVEATQMAGILNGVGGNRFDPQGTATRAEVAAVLHRYVELIVDPAATIG